MYNTYILTMMLLSNILIIDAMNEHPMQLRSMVVGIAESSGRRLNPEIEAAKAAYQHARDHIMESTFMGGQSVEVFSETDKEKIFNHAHLLFQDIELHNAKRMRTSLRKAVLGALSCAGLSSLVAFVCIGAANISMKDKTSIFDPKSISVPDINPIPLPLVNEACCCCLAATVACAWCINNSSEWCQAFEGKRRAQYYKNEYEKVMHLKPN